MNDFNVLIIGSDSLIGKQLRKTMADNGIKTWGTSRRQANLNTDIYYLNLCDASVESIDLPLASTVIFCAGVSGYELCSNTPALAAQVNMVNTLKLATRFLQNKCHVIFISSAAAIGSSESLKEDAVCSPLTVYGALKYATELGLAAEARRYGLLCLL
jgi:nucleoside-diphosphate-sugar epimerase